MVALGAVGGRAAAAPPPASAPAASSSPVPAGAPSSIPPVPTAAAAIASGPPLPGLAPATLTYALFYGVLSRDLAVAEAVYRIEPGRAEPERSDSGTAQAPAADRGAAPDRYRIATEGKAIGIVAMVYSGTLTQSSEGRIDAGGLRPERYTEQRGRRPERRLRFDAGRRVMIGTGNPPEVALPDGTQDRLSIFFQLGLLARGREALFRPGQRFTLPLASMRTIDWPTFTVAGREGQRTPLGTLDCLRVTVRNEADAKDPVFDVWLAVAHAMLPARIRMQEQDGKIIDQVLQRAG